MFSFEQIKKFSRIILLVIRQLGLALLSLFLTLTFVGLLFELLKEISPVLVATLVTVGPSTLGSWAALTSVVVLPFVVLALLIAHDARKFEKHGLKTRAFWWGFVSLPPLLFITIPLYFLVREFVWVKKVGDLVEQDALARQSNIEQQIGKVIKRGWFLNGVLIIFLVYLLIVLNDIPGKLSKGKTEEIVAKIHATKLTMDDVEGVNLPPDPGAEADRTVAGVDANINGIRDDVELAIFEKYPDSIKTRAVLLQYAMALQMEVTQPFVNTLVAQALIQEESRGFVCIGKIVSRESIKEFTNKTDELTFFLENLQLNSQERRSARDTVLQKAGAPATFGASCDIDYQILKD